MYKNKVPRAKTNQRSDTAAAYKIVKTAPKYKTIPGSRPEEKRHSFKIPLLIFIFILIAVLGAGFYIMKTYTIKTVYVEGNLHYTQEEIQDIVMEGPLGNNSLYLSIKYKNKGVENIPFVDVMDVSILAPDTIRISVYEKALAGYVNYLDTYMYFDKDGYVVECSDVLTVGVPQVTGLTFDHIVLGEILPVEEKEIFNSIMDITNLLNKYELAADKIFFHSSKEITIYFGDVKAALGSNSSNLEEKIMRLPQFLSKISEQKGVLRMENYSDDNTDVTFELDAQY